MKLDPELAQSFIVEARDSLEAAESALIELRNFTGDDAETLREINAVFRTFHSIKGSAAFMELLNIVSFTHKAENMLDLLRSGKMTLTPPLLDLLFRSADLLGMLLGHLETNLSDDGFEDERIALEVDIGNVIEGGVAEATPAAELEALFAVPASASPSPAEPEPITDIPFMTITAEMVERFAKDGAEIVDHIEQQMLSLQENPTASNLINETFREFHTLKGNSGFMGYGDLERVLHAAETVLDGMREGKVQIADADFDTFFEFIDLLKEGIRLLMTGAPVPCAANACEKFKDSFRRMVDRGLGKSPEQPALPPVQTAARVDVPPPAATPAAPPPPVPAKQKAEEPAPKAAAAATVIRVDTEKLDKLMNLVGELVITSAMITRRPDSDGFSLEAFESNALQLQRVMTGLQEVVMTMRMIPLSSTFKKLVRVVHDISRKSGKQVDIRFAGEETEVDKTVIEYISDPLVHMIRNSVDHGIEPPDERAARGKPAKGDVFIDARHEGGEVVISISDDGRGLNRARILQKAIERGLVRGDGSDMPDGDVFRLVFEPGFSTAEKVTEISGRGVGMDVVKGNIEKINGRIDIRSTPGKGAIFIIHIPLTLAIIDGMLLRVGASHYTIPMLSIRESFKPESSMITITPDGQEIVKVRDELIPVIRLGEMFNCYRYTRNWEEGMLIVAEARGEIAALFVDELMGQNQAVIKALPAYLGNVKGISSCTILGDGEVSLILDIGGIVEKARAADALAEGAAV